MSMICALVFVADDEIAQLLAEPESICDFLDQERTSTDLAEARSGTQNRQAKRSTIAILGAILDGLDQVPVWLESYASQCGA